MILDDRTLADLSHRRGTCGAPSAADALGYVTRRPDCDGEGGSPLTADRYGLDPAVEPEISALFARQWGDRIFRPFHSGETMQRCDCCGLRRDFHCEDGLILCRVCLAARRRHIERPRLERLARHAAARRRWYWKMKFRRASGGACWAPLSTWHAKGRTT